MSQLKYAPLLTAAAVGVAEDMFARGTGAKLAVKGSGIPRLAADTALVAVGLFGAKVGIPRNVATATGVAGAAILGRTIPYIVTGREKL